MIDQEILFLGLLMDGPKHGYDIKRQIHEDLTPLMGLKIKSIYYPLKKMAEDGLIVQSADREGNWPEKFVYSITTKGKKRFHVLVQKNFVLLERPFFHMNLSLYFLEHVDKTIAKRRLKARLVLLKKVKLYLAHFSGHHTKDHVHWQYIVEHDIDLCEAEIKSLTRLLRSLE